MRRKDKGQPDAGASDELGANEGAHSRSQAADRRLTPVDIQQKVFRLAIRGYNEREVDQFLDEVTEEMARLHADNKRLREDLEYRGTARLQTGAALEGDVVVQRAREEADRIIAEAESRARGIAVGPEWKAGVGRFLTREKEFLQSLASLIQQHAEGVKDDAQRSRDEAAALPQPVVRTGREPLIDLTPEKEVDGARGADDSRREEALSPANVGFDVSRSDASGEPEGPEGGSGDRTVRELFWGED